ncbi:MAG TPA: hypothetical protein DF698_03945 [Candidatus Atribacteria bacterium]|nr:hypothetical protein [Candidatus Atribacteria bacterium]
MSLIFFIPLFLDKGSLRRILFFLILSNPPYPIFERRRLVLEHIFSPHLLPQSDMAVYLVKRLGA